ARKYHGVIERVYMKMDEALAKCMAALGDDVTYIVMSDHGFGNFRRQFGLNTWLRQEGYLDCDDNSDDIFMSPATNWNNTRAYGLGINGLYLNLKGRERMGIVDPRDRDALLDEISARLLAITDPAEPSIHPIRRVYRANECYKGAEVVNA